MWKTWTQIQGVEYFGNKLVEVYTFMQVGQKNGLGAGSFWRDTGATNAI